MDYNIVVGELKRNGRETYVDSYVNDLASEIDASILPVEIVRYGAREVKPILKFGLDGYVNNEDVRNSTILVAIRDDRFEPDSNAYLNINDFILDALRKSSTDYEVDVLIPYMYYARQDRVSQIGEPLSIETLADTIDAWGITNLYTFNSHLYGRSKGDRLGDKFGGDTHVHDIGAGELLADAIIKEFDPECPIIINPDGRHDSRMQGFIGSFKNYNFGYVVQKRDPSTGVKKVIRDNLDEVLAEPDSEVIIFDDLTDSGGTITRAFEYVMKYEPGSVYVAVPHTFTKAPIKKFTKLAEENEGILKGIFTTDSFSMSEQDSDPFNDFIEHFSEESTVDLLASTIREVSSSLF